MQNHANSVMSSPCITDINQNHLQKISQSFTQIKTLQAKMKQAGTIQEVNILQVDIGKAFQTLKAGIQRIKHTS